MKKATIFSCHLSPDDAILTFVILFKILPIPLIALALEKVCGALMGKQNPNYESIYRKVMAP